MRGSKVYPLLPSCFANECTQDILGTWHRPLYKDANSHFSEVMFCTQVPCSHKREANGLATVIPHGLFSFYSLYLGEHLYRTTLKGLSSQQHPEWALTTVYDKVLHLKVC